MIRAAGRAVALLALLAPAIAAAQVKAPRVSARSVAWLPYPLPAPYDPRRDARHDVDAAIARAKQSGKPVLIDFGANWCINCRVLAGALALPEMRTWVADKFELVQVDIGRFDRNLDVVRRFGVRGLDGVPAIFVVDARTGKLRNKRETSIASDSVRLQPQEAADWLARWAR